MTAAGKGEAGATLAQSMPNALGDDASVEARTFP